MAQRYLKPSFSSFFSNSLDCLRGTFAILQGRVIADRMVCHAYAFEDGLIKSMEIKEPTGA